MFSLNLLRNCKVGAKLCRLLRVSCSSSSSSSSSHQTVAFICMHVKAVIVHFHSSSSTSPLLRLAVSQRSNLLSLSSREEKIASKKIQTKQNKTHKNKNKNTHTHTHTDTERERERERETSTPQKQRERNQERRDGTGRLGLTPSATQVLGTS